MLVEINIDALSGPTHHFGGLGVGNVASRENRWQVSHPKRAALEGLEKAALIASLGVPQFLWLPPRRPNFALLNNLGFVGTLAEQLANARQTDPAVLSAVFSGAFLWAANSATVSPAVDCRDGRYHFTPANLISSWHRSSEAADRKLDLENMFSIHDYHLIHEPLPSIVPLRDEGAANHLRLCDDSGELGFNVFVFGESGSSHRPNRFLARQTLAACQAIARRHGLEPQTTFYLQQHPESIDAGVFHNDVIATSHRGLLIHHELAYLDGEKELERLESVFLARTGKRLLRRIVAQSELTLSEAVQTYFFNCQIVTPYSDSSFTPDSVIVCPAQCLKVLSGKKLVDNLLADAAIPISLARYVTLQESMAGGGGPACLRLRVSADERTLAQLPSETRLTDARLERLREAIEKWYPEQLIIDQFADFEFVEHLDRIYQELSSSFFS